MIDLLQLSIRAKTLLERIKVVLCLKKRIMYSFEFFPIELQDKKRKLYTLFSVFFFFFLVRELKDFNAS